MSFWRSPYSALWRLLSPLAKAYLRRRGKRSPAYLEHWDERFSTRTEARQQNALWIHAVSVGETRAALPLVAELRRRWPQLPLLLTQMTPTGRATALELYPDAEVRYLPYDSREAVQRFLDAYRPRVGILMETEIWPNLIHGCAERDIPLFLANARLSEKSLRGYRRVSALISPALGCLTGVAAQTEDDAARLSSLGAADVQVCGNTKFDFVPPAGKVELGRAFREAVGERKVVVCGSTREGEEALILDAWAAHSPSDVLLVLVPRHPERFDAVAALVAERGLALQRRSEGMAIGRQTGVWLGDSMGELFAYYAMADLAFVGGSLLPLGGQNLIEPASVGVPVLFGPSMFNFAEASRLALAAGAAREVADAAALVDACRTLLGDDAGRYAMHEAALAFSRSHQGACSRIADYVEARLAAQGVSLPR
ncbi:lipid IV(A) 3-deoxy-D-manno-octulosonic acid transferase [Crenobacter caeni]|uniref:3-deoxy-D-manno-octulosonic acid transferase n=1 Tax=Crenobacter caeni TaxID=2705474 RepID=A0A6B2KV87_9NEIS|nr:lipid IV(A) 3-deoxy-D-manno-octulosonic acid transferase [Crenobacter caeni]NDV14175.1 3-deoxy-D-manno-octulosonic acid transferase [Crenobacter caeni]